MPFRSGFEGGGVWPLATNSLFFRPGKIPCFGPYELKKIASVSLFFGYLGLFVRATDAKDRKCVVEGKSVGLGGSRIIKNKQTLR